MTDLDWVAGFLDGEGCFNLGGYKKRYPKISANQLHREPLDIIQSVLGGKVSGPYISPSRKNPIYVWRVGRNDEVRKALELIIPRMNHPIKVQEAKRILELL